MSLSKFADKLSADAGIIDLMQDLGDALNSNKKMYMLGGGNPSHITAMEQYFREQMLAIASDPTRFGKMVGDYDGPQGNARFIDALASFFQDIYNWPINKENIAITNGSQASFGLLFNMLAGACNHGQNKQILLPLTPEYIGYSDVALDDHPLFTARRPLIEKLDNIFYKYRVDFDRLDVDESIGALCVSRPTNPTGNVITDNELTHLSALCRKNDIPLIIDSAYGLPFPNIVFSEASPLWEEHTILCFSLSKLGLPGVRTGIIIANEDIILRVKNANAIFNLAPGSVGPELLSESLQSGKLLSLCKEVIQPYYLKRRDEALAQLQYCMGDLPVRIHQPEGAIFLWLWFENLPITVQELYKRLKARQVLVIAGHHFFPGLEEDWQHKHECIRITYSSDPQSVEHGMKILANEVRRAYTQVQQA